MTRSSVRPRPRRASHPIALASLLIGCAVPTSERAADRADDDEELRCDPSGGAECPALQIAAPAAGVAVGGTIQVAWSAADLEGRRVRLSGWTAGASDRGQCDDRAAGAPFNGEADVAAGALGFDTAHCAPAVAPGERLRLRLEAVTSDGAALSPPVVAETEVVIAGASRGVLYTPDAAVLDEYTAYPHAIRLSHAGERDGTILATFERHVSPADHARRGWRIYRSTDGGQSFVELATIEPHELPDAVVTWQPTLLELSRETAGFPPGTLLFAGDTIAGGRDELQLFRSVDHGESWQFVSRIEAGDDAVGPQRPWEPFLIQRDDGSLVAYYSDERTPVASQSIALKVSYDGGATWVEKRQVFESSDPSDRPGMASVARLADGRYAMVIEMCGAPGDFCRARLKYSDDGLVFGDGPTDMGSRPAAALTGHILAGNPYVAWHPAGGPDGTLIVGAGFLHESAAPGAPLAGGDGQTLLVNYEAGAGPWYELTAPVRYVRGDPHTSNAGYRSAFLPLSDDASLLGMVATYVGGGIRNSLIYGSANAGVLPYRDPFAGGVDVGWQTFGGSWAVADGAYVNTSGGAGDKAVVGSTGWRDYTVEADVRLDGQGNAGLLFRASDPRIGVDAHRGYYAGVSTQDSTAFIGRQQDDWQVLGAAEPVAGGVAVGAWVHLAVEVVGCGFTMTVTGPSGATTSLTREDPGCAPTGQVGVRTFLSPAAWRHVRVTAAGGTR